jgi:hypothetical protein
VIEYRKYLKAQANDTCPDPGIGGIAYLIFVISAWILATYLPTKWFASTKKSEDGIGLSVILTGVFFMLVSGSVLLFSVGFAYFCIPW